MKIQEQMASLQLGELEFMEAVSFLNQPKKDAAPKEMIISTVKKVPTFTPKTTFFSLPLEVRQMIYEEVYEGEWPSDGILDWAQIGLYYYENYKTSFPNIGLSRVCRQMYSEVTPYIYKKVRMGLPLEDWHRFFCDIGHHNICHIQELTIEYKCSLWGGAWDCWGRDAYKDNYSKWEGIFRNLSLGKIKPKRVTIYFDPCEEYSTTEDGTPVDGYQYRRCQVYEDKWFVKGIVRCFWQAWKIELRGKFNPRWGHTLRRRLKFILKRDGDERMTLFNPDFIRHSVDLKDCIKTSNGLYDQIQKPLPELTW
ncbi:hypothetical protein F4815DRAFT_502794 [Daldinia loculata]|nr:hypothetical protein F4815DRAFT_502794 [Daldinia loculata]